MVSSEDRRGPQPRAQTSPLLLPNTVIRIFSTIVSTVTPLEIRSRNAISSEKSHFWFCGTLATQSQYLLYHVLAVWHAHALLDDISAAIKDDQRGNTPYAVPLCSLASYLAHYVQPENRCPFSEVLLYPIHDGLGH